MNLRFYSLFVLKSLMSFVLLAAIPLHAQVSKKESKDLKELRAKAEKGDTESQFSLARRYADGVGIPKNVPEAVNWYRKAAERGHELAQISLGILFDKGELVPKDSKESVKWLRKAADQGNMTAKLLLQQKLRDDAVRSKVSVEEVESVRKGAENGVAASQNYLGFLYQTGAGVPENAEEAVKWYRKAAEQGFALAQSNLGFMYFNGRGVPVDSSEAAKWLRKAAEQGISAAQSLLGFMHEKGDGVNRDAAEAVRWYRKSAEQGHAVAQYSLGTFHWRGEGVVKDEVESYKWFLLAGAQGYEFAKEKIPLIERDMSPSQRAEGQKLARDWKPQVSGNSPLELESIDNAPKSSGSGFFITEDGYFITNQHVASEGTTVRLLTAAGSVAAKVVKVDKANDLALLKADGKFTALPVITSRGVRLGATAATVGFPNTGLQGFAPKLARGEIASLAGAQDDARHFQISAPIQPGNSGGALVDERGNVIGVVVAKLSQRAALATSGALAENVNYAVKSSYLLSFLESVPAVAAKLKDAHTKERKFEDVVKAVEQATVLVLVY